MVTLSAALAAFMAAPAAPDPNGCMTTAQALGQLQLLQQGAPDTGQQLERPDCSITGSLGNTILNGDGSSGVGTLVHQAGKFFTGTPSPNVADPDTGALRGAAGFLTAHTAWFTSALFVIAILVAAVRIIRRSNLEDLLSVLVGFIIVTAAVGGIVAAILVATDAYAPWIIQQASGVGYEESLRGMMGTAGDATPLSPITDIMLTIVAWGAAALQVGILWVITAMLPITLGLWPLFAGIEAIKSGNPMNTPITPMIAAMVLYKFVAATIWSGVFYTIDPKNGANPWLAIVVLLVSVGLFPLLWTAFTKSGVPGTGLIRSGTRGVAGAFG